MKIIPKLPNYSPWSALALPGMSQHVVMDVLSKEHSGGTATATFAWKKRWPLQDPVKHVLPPGEDDEARFVGGSGRDWDFQQLVKRCTFLQHFNQKKDD